MSFCVAIYHACGFKIFRNVLVFLYVKANSKEICEEISFSSFFFRKILKSAFFGYPPFSLWIPIALAKIYFFRVVLTWRKILCI